MEFEEDNKDSMDFLEEYVKCKKKNEFSFKLLGYILFSLVSLNYNSQFVWLIFYRNIYYTDFFFWLFLIIMIILNIVYIKICSSFEDLFENFIY